MGERDGLRGSCLIAKRMVREIDHAATGRRARQARTATGLSLREVARRMSVSAPYLSDLERGRRAWNENRAQRYVEALGTQPDLPPDPAEQLRRSMEMR